MVQKTTNEFICESWFPKRCGLLLLSISILLPGQFLVRPAHSDPPQENAESSKPTKHTPEGSTKSPMSPGVEVPGMAGAAPNSEINDANGANEPDPTLVQIERLTAQIRLLLQEKLAPNVEPQSLFGVDLTRPREVNLEVRRLRAGLTAAGVFSDLAEGSAEEAPPSAVEGAPVTGAPEPAPVPDAAKTPTTTDADERLWLAQLDLDRARFRFLSLSEDQRRALLDSHQARAREQAQAAGERQLTEAEREALRAEQELKEALKEADAAKTEAARRVSEEHARLLEISRLQAEFRSNLDRLKEGSAARSEDLLSWERRVKETVEADPSPSAVGALYAELLDHLKKRRAQFRTKLSRLSSLGNDIPRPGEDRLKELPEGVDRSRVLTERRKVLERADELEKTERELERESASTLMLAVQGLNELRLKLLPYLSDEERSSTTGIGRDGFRQAAAEFEHLALSFRYRSFALRQWIEDARNSSARRQESAWTAAWLLARWILPLGIFIWWKRRAEEILINLRKRFAQERRKYRRRTPEAERPERFITFLLRVRTPLEWLALVNATAWILPTDGSELSKASALLVSLNWIFCGQFAVRSLDALSSSEIRGIRTAAQGTERAQLRYRSLRLVGLAVVIFGLILSLSSDILGEGTLYSWLVFLSWIAAVPLLLTLIAWWRPGIFERFELSRRKRPFEAWVLKNREGKLSSLAAVLGGVYLFSYGVFRTVRSWIVTFSITRRVLAYLFRRGMERQAKTATLATYDDLPSEKMEVLSPDRPAQVFIPSAADASLKQVIRRIASAGGGIFAIVGERGLGKSTLLSRIENDVGEVTRMNCPRGGVEAFGQELNRVLRHSHSTTIEMSAQVLDSKILDSALLVDDAQHLIQPSIGGLADLDEVLDLARSHSSNCAWVFAFDAVIWRFLERARGSRPLFDDVIVLRPWSEESIVELLTSRNAEAELDPGFEDLLTELPPDADEIDRAEALQKTEASYYRLLWDYASGNPAVALHFWRGSLGLNNKGEGKVRLFNAPGVEELETLPDSAVFVLRAIVQLGSAGVPEICAATSLPERQVRDALRYGSVRGYFDIEDERYHINWIWFRAITRFLFRRHLIFSGAG